jgi:hypothetical protein
LSKITYFTGDEIGHSCADYLFEVPVTWESENGLARSESSMRVMIRTGGNSLRICFGQTPEGDAYKYEGFLLDGDGAKEFFDFIRQAEANHKRLSKGYL